jgi:recombination protein RecT
MPEYKAVAQRPSTNGKAANLAVLIEQMKPEIARALPRHMNPDRMARIATTVLRQNPALNRCTPESFLGALMTASQLGLEPGPLGEAYLVPYGNIATFIPGYRGLIKLALQSPNVSKARARVVYEHDHFDYAFGIEERLEHTPTKGDRGKVTHVYAFVKYTDGGSDFDVMSVDDVEKLRSRSKAGKSGPWVTDWEAMALKTVFKRLSKWMPLSSEFATAAALDGTVRTAVTDLDTVLAAPTYVDSEIVEEDEEEDQGDLNDPTPALPDVIAKIDA